MWVRGLKQIVDDFSVRLVYVAPHVGAWIETSFGNAVNSGLAGRTPCGCVD